MQEQSEAKRVAEYLLQHRVILSSIHKSIVRPIEGTPPHNPVYLKHPQDWEFLPYRVEIVEQFKQLNVEFGLCSNEGGVAAGFFPGWEMILELRKIANLLQARTLQYCVYSPASRDGRYAGQSSRQFPNPEMIQEAILDISVCLKEEIYPADVLFLYSFPFESEAAKSLSVHRLAANRVFTEEVHDELERILLEK